MDFSKDYLERISNLQSFIYISPIIKKIIVLQNLSEFRRTIDFLLKGFQVGNLIELNRFVTFITTKNAVKLGFFIQIIFVIYSHSIVAGGLLVMS